MQNKFLKEILLHKNMNFPLIYTYKLKYTTFFSNKKIPFKFFAERPIVSVHTVNNFIKRKDINYLKGC